MKIKLETESRINALRMMNGGEWPRTCAPSHPIPADTDIEYVTKFCNARSQQPFEVRITQRVKDNGIRVRTKVVFHLAIN